MSVLKIKDDQGNWVNIPALKGDTGNGIESVEKTGTSGLVDTYTVEYTDGTTSTFDVTNGEKGDKGEKGDPIDVKVNETSIITDNVANIPVLGNEINSVGDHTGLVSIHDGYSTGWQTVLRKGIYCLEPRPASANGLKVSKNANNNGYGVVDSTNHHTAAFYGLAKASGDTTQSASDNAVGTYTDEAKVAIKTMLGVTDPIVSDVQVNGTSIVTNGVADIPVMTYTDFGVAKVQSNLGIWIDGSGYLRTYKPTANNIKAGTDTYKPLTVSNQHESVFYGLAKLAGADMAQSDNPVGTFTDEAKIAIQKMLGIHPIGDFEEIARYTVPEDTDRVIVDTDINGLPFKLAHAMICIKLKEPTTGTADYVSAQIKFDNDTYYGLPTLRWLSNTLDRTWLVFEFTSFNGMPVAYGKATAIGNSQNAQMGTYITITGGQTMFMKTNYIKAVRFLQYSSNTSLIPANSEVIVYGCRYYD